MNSTGIGIVDKAGHGLSTSPFTLLPNAYNPGSSSASYPSMWATMCLLLDFLKDTQMDAP